MKKEEKESIIQEIKNRLKEKTNPPQTGCVYAGPEAFDRSEGPAGFMMVYAGPTPPLPHSQQAMFPNMNSSEADGQSAFPQFASAESNAPEADSSGPSGTDPASVKPKKFCPECGFLLKGTPKFCPECGVKVN